MNHLKFIKELKIEIDRIFVNNLESNNVEIKKDKSFVTKIDLEIDKAVKTIAKKYLDFNYYSEESSERDFLKPLLIVDPIDGTKGLVKQNGEYCVSVGYWAEDSWGWLYYPDEKIEIHSNDSTENIHEHTHGLVSRSDYERGLFADETLEMVPMGSIAKKLGYLAQGKCRFVYSKTNKNVWDIFAGTVICQRKGLYLYNKNGKINSYKKYYEGPLLWCTEKDFDELRELINEF
tara:strand:+ start:209273 stop:209971 length:699 start_codon:yes stop_codon:yes gene_type:complete